MTPANPGTVNYPVVTPVSVPFISNTNTTTPVIVTSTEQDFGTLLVDANTTGITFNPVNGSPTGWQSTIRVNDIMKLVVSLDAELFNNILIGFDWNLGGARANGSIYNFNNPGASAEIGGRLVSWRSEERGAYLPGGTYEVEYYFTPTATGSLSVEIDVSTIDDDRTP